MVYGIDNQIAYQAVKKNGIRINHNRKFIIDREIQTVVFRNWFKEEKLLVKSFVKTKLLYLFLLGVAYSFEKKKVFF